jgi:hypothetical protein
MLSKPDFRTHRKIRAHIKRRININQIHLALKRPHQRSHHQLVVAPHQPIVEIIHPWVLLLKQRQRLIGRRLSPRLINLLNLLHRHRTSGNIHLPSMPILVILALPHQLRPHLRQWVRIVGAVGGLLGHGAMGERDGLPQIIATVKPQLKRVGWGAWRWGRSISRTAPTND